MIVNRTRLTILYVSCLLLCTSIVKSIYWIIGTATSFFNEKNKNVAKDLVDLLVEAKQRVPGWLDEVAAEMRYHSNNKRGGRR